MRYRLRGRERVRHTIAGNQFSTAVTVNEENASVNAEHLEQADSSGPKFAVRGRVECCRLWFGIIGCRVKVDVVFSVNVGAHFLEACIKTVFVPFLCSDHVPVCSLWDTAHLAKEFFWFLGQGPGGFRPNGEGKEKGDVYSGQARAE